MKPHDHEVTPQELINAFHAHKLSEIAGLNFLTTHGAISDNVVWTADIAPQDRITAIEFMNDL